MNREELVERARSLAPALRERAAEAEALRRMPDQTVADLVDAGLHRICQPARFGGFELGWDALCPSTMELARGDGSQAWVTNIYAEHNFLTALFPDQAQHDVWDDNPDALISSSINPVGNQVETVSGGYVLTGRWPFASGLHHSHWSILGDFVRDGDRTQHHFFLVPAADRKPVDDWHTVGMAATGSASMELDHVFVPAHRALSNARVAEGRTPGAEVNTASIYRMPMFGFSHLALGSVPVGMAEAMVEEFAAFFATKDYGESPPLWIGNILARVSEATAETRAARLLILDAAEANMRKLAEGGSLDMTDAARSGLNGTYAGSLARRAAARLFEAVGAHGIFLDGSMQRRFRDIYAATVHNGLNWDRASERFGRLAIGMPPAPPPF